MFLKKYYLTVQIIFIIVAMLLITICNIIRS